MSILRPRPDSISAPQSRAILAAAPPRREPTRHSARTSASPLRRLRYLLLLLFLLTPLPNRAHSNTLRIPFRTVRSMILIEAEVNGEPVTLLMDTGATTTIINAQSYRATYFPLRAAQRNTKSAGIVGESIPVRLDLRLANHRWIGQPVTIMNLDDLNRLLGAQFDGLLGQDILREFHSVRIDYRNRLIELEE